MRLGDALLFTLKWLGQGGEWRGGGGKLDGLSQSTRTSLLRTNIKYKKYKHEKICINRNMNKKTIKYITQFTELSSKAEK